MAEDKIVVKIESDIIDLIPRFLDKRRKNLVEIKDALHNGDLTVVHQIAHKIKGSSGLYGFIGLHELGKAMEEAGKAGDANIVKESLKRAEDYLSRVEVEEKA